MTTDLGLTNVFLGIMAVVSLLEALAVFGLVLGGVPPVSTGRGGHERHRRATRRTGLGTRERDP